MTRPMVQIEDVTLTRAGRRVLDGLSLEVPEGAVYGVIGPSGSGKSALIKLLAGLLDPDAGALRVDGLDVRANGEAVRRRIGYMPDYLGAYDDLTVSDYLFFFARTLKVEPNRAARRGGEVLEQVGLAAEGEQRIDTLTREQKYQLVLAKTLLNDPPLILLDNPAGGLPLPARIRQRELIGSVIAPGRTVLMTTGIVSDLLGLCSHVTVIHEGRILTSGPIGEIASTLGAGRLVEFRLPESETVETFCQLLSRHPGVRQVESHGPFAICTLDIDIQDPSELVRRLVAGGAALNAYREHQIQVDEPLIRHLTASKSPSGSVS